jgi:hypothetical protein
MKKIIILLAGIALLSSCNCLTSDKNEQVNNITSVTMEEFLANPDEFLEKEIVITGLVTHVCKHGGQKLFIAGENEATSLLINTSESIPEFSIDLEGSKAEFTGTAKVMDSEKIATELAEDADHHPEGEGVNCDAEKAADKEYYLIASSFKKIDLE